MLTRSSVPYRMRPYAPNTNPDVLPPMTHSLKDTWPGSSPAAPAATISGMRCSSRGWDCGVGVGMHTVSLDVGVQLAVRYELLEV